MRGPAPLVGAAEQYRLAVAAALPTAPPPVPDLGHLATLRHVQVLWGLWAYRRSMTGGWSGVGRAGPIHCMQCALAVCVTEVPCPPEYTVPQPTKQTPTVSGIDFHLRESAAAHDVLVAHLLRFQERAAQHPAPRPPGTPSPIPTPHLIGSPPLFCVHNASNELSPSVLFLHPQSTSSPFQHSGTDSGDEIRSLPTGLQSPSLNPGGRGRRPLAAAGARGGGQRPVAGPHPRPPLPRPRRRPHRGLHRPPAVGLSKTHP